MSLPGRTRTQTPSEAAARGLLHHNSLLSTHSSHAGPIPAWQQINTKQTFGKLPQPPAIAPARGPPPLEEEDSGAIVLDEERFTGDPLVQPQPV
jgi:hypothetical protein